MFSAFLQHFTRRPWLIVSKLLNSTSMLVYAVSTDTGIFTNHMYLWYLWYLWLTGSLIYGVVKSYPLEKAAVFQHFAFTVDLEIIVRLNVS